MPHFDRIREPGFWTVGPLYHTEMELIDAMLSKAINGDEGGVWAPSSPIIIGGAGCQFTGPTVYSFQATYNAPAEFNNGFGVTSIATFHSGVEMEDTLSVGGDPIIGYRSVFYGASRFVGSVSVTTTLSTGTSLSVGTTLGVSGDTTLAGNLGVSGTTTLLDRVGVGGAADGTLAFKVTGGAKITGAATFLSTIAVDGAATLNGSLNVAGDTTLSGDLDVGGLIKAKGRHQRRVYRITSALGQSFGILTCDVAHLRMGVLSGPLTVTLVDTGAEEGDVIKIATEDTAHTLTVVTTTYTFFLLSANTVAKACVELTFDNGAWRATDFGLVTARAAAIAEAARATPRADGAVLLSRHARRAPAAAGARVAG